jgi:hypothetical protein
MIHFKSRKRPGKSGRRLGLSRAAATGYSPGLQPWVDGLKRARPESTPNPADAGCNSKLAQYSNTPILHHSAWPDSRTRTTTRTRTKRLTSGARHWIVWPRDNETSSANTFGRHFSSFVPCPPTMEDSQGASFGNGNPGLKPWAMICSRFAATPTDSPDKI